MTARCLVGTNGWAIEGQFTRNSSNTWWFSGTNLVERTIIDKLIPEPDRSRPSTPGFLAVGVPPVGQRFTHIYESADGNPGRRVRVSDLMTPDARACWVPFCSAPTLNNPGHQLYPPYDLWKELINAPTGFVERTSRFDDALGLPKSVDLNLPNGQPVLQYRVTGTTNVLGWELPLEFYLAQYRPAYIPGAHRLTTNGWELGWTVHGSVTEIEVTTNKLELPSAAVTEAIVASIIDDWQKLPSIFDHIERYSRQVRQVVEIGKPAVPQLVAALDEAYRDPHLRLLAFTLRAIGDPRAVPALIRALPKTLLPPGSDCAMSVPDQDLFDFMLAHDLDLKGEERGDRRTFSMGRPVREVAAALRKITGTRLNESELFQTFLEGGRTQRATERKAYYDVARHWADWWEGRANAFVDDPSLAAVNLPPLKQESPQQRFLAGPGVKVSAGMAGMLVSPVEGRTRCGLQLVLNRSVDLPQSLFQTNSTTVWLDQVTAWAARAGVDVLGDEYREAQSGQLYYCLRAVGLQAWQIPNEDWSRIEQEVGRDALPPLTAPAGDLLMHYDPGISRYMPEKRATFLFIARDGSQGILRITGQVNQLRGGQRGLAFDRSGDGTLDQTFEPGPALGVKVDYRFFYLPDEADRSR
jgi:hypothetical protein